MPRRLRRLVLPVRRGHGLVVLWIRVKRQCRQSRPRRGRHGGRSRCTWTWSWPYPCLCPRPDLAREVCWGIACLELAIAGWFGISVSMCNVEGRPRNAAGSEEPRWHRRWSRSRNFGIFVCTLCAMWRGGFGTLQGQSPERAPQVVMLVAWGFDGTPLWLSGPCVCVVCVQVLARSDTTHT